MVSFVAGAATGPFAIQHFNRVANYGVFANLTRRLGRQRGDDAGAGLGADAEALTRPRPRRAGAVRRRAGRRKAVIALGHLFATAPGAGDRRPSAPEIALAISYLGILFVCLWRGRLRWIGLPLAAAVALWPRPAPPVIWIASDGDDAAVAIEGQEVALRPGVRAYATQLWAQRRGFSLPADAAAAQAAAFTCDRKACAPKAGVRPALAAWWSTRAPPPGKLEALCPGADILILRAAVQPPAPCQGALVLGPDAFARGGAAEIYAQDRGWRIVWSEPMRGRRPWTAPAPDETDAEAGWTTNPVDR